jgi:hypothetical protein
MDLNLLDRALEAEEVAGGLQIFLDHLPRRGTHISGNIGKIFVISSALRSLDADLASPMLAPGVARVAGDLRLVLRSFGLTVDSIKDMFSRARYAAHSGRAAYGPAWEWFQMRMAHEGPDLSYRMSMYNTFLNALGGIVRGYGMRLDPYFRNMLTSSQRECEQTCRPTAAG